jgi:hypothetical protein
MLYLKDAATASDMQQHLLSACTSHDTAAAYEGGPLLLPTLGPRSLESLPLAIAKLRGTDGGLGLPSLRDTCTSAHVAQRLTTLKPRLLATANRLSGALPQAWASTPSVVAFRHALQTLCTSTTLTDRVQEDCRLTAWATTGSTADEDASGDDDAALAAIMSEGLLLSKQADEDSDDHDFAHTDTTSMHASSGTGTTDSTTNNTTGGQQPATTTTSSTNNTVGKATQRKLATLQHKASAKQLMTQLATCGDAGKRALAQLRSQKAPHAKAWLGLPGLRHHMSPLLTAAMTLSTLQVSPFTLSGDGCPYPGCTHKGPVTVEHMLTCTHQHLRGPNATHTTQERGFMRLCDKCHVRGCVCEDNTVFNVPHAGQHSYRGDVILQPGSLSMCSDRTLRTKGVITDSSISSPVAGAYVRGAAVQDGYTAEARETQKHNKYQGTFAASRYQFVPIVQEIYGRLGRQAGALFKQMAIHSAHCTGGTEHDIKKRAGYMYSYICDEMSTTLAVELGERLLAFVRGARFHSREHFAISSLLEPLADGVHS